MLRARAHTSQVDFGFSLVGEVKMCLPNADKLKGIYNNAQSSGAGLAAVFAEIKRGEEQLPAYGPVHQIADMV